ncbi:MAG TPA: histidine phosphatase family protein [Burkholderiaceae bacterium]|nr:histidine phosphatase family protein [Burkholderiaceae bacterium]
MRLFLIRHPEPQVAPATCYGNSDLPVSPQAHARAWAALHPQLNNNTLGTPGTPLFSSPLRRCAELADMLGDTLGGKPVTMDARLKEMHFGTWELRRWSDIARAEIDAWADDVLTYRPGGGETVMEVAERVQAFQRDLMHRQLEQAIVVCHAGTIRMFLALQHGLPLAAAAQHAARHPHAIGYGELTILDIQCRA